MSGAPKPGRIGVTKIPPKGNRKLPRFRAHLTAPKLGFYVGLLLGEFMTREDAALAVDRGRIVIGLPPINHPDAVHEEAALAEMRTHIARRKPTWTPPTCTT